MLKFFDAIPEGSRIFLTLDPGFGMEKFGSGINTDANHGTRRRYLEGYTLGQGARQDRGHSGQVQGDVPEGINCCRHSAAHLWTVTHM
jgi:hypothetical protein